MKVLVTDGLAKEGIAYLEKEGFEVKDITGASEAEVIAEIADYDAFIVRSATTVTPAIIDAGAKLKVIGRAGIGTDNIDKPYAKEKGIAVVNAPTSNSISACEQAFALMLCTARKTAIANESMHAGKWEKSKFKGVELFEKTLGICGLGNIGVELAKRAQAFGMKVVVYDPFAKQEKAAALGVELYTDLNEMCKVVDFMSVHVPLTPQTKGMIGAEQIELMKKGVILVNDARGGIYDTDAVVAGLESGKIAGYGVDVYEVEPCTESPLHKFENVVMTPHLGASTKEAQTRASTQICEFVVLGLTKGEFPTRVNK